MNGEQIHLAMCAVVNIKYQKKKKKVNLLFAHSGV